MRIYGKEIKDFLQLKKEEGNTTPSLFATSFIPSAGLGSKILQILTPQEIKIDCEDEKILINKNLFWEKDCEDEKILINKNLFWEKTRFPYLLNLFFSLREAQEFYIKAINTHQQKLEKRISKLQKVKNNLESLKEQIWII